MDGLALVDILLCEGFRLDRRGGVLFRLGCFSVATRYRAIPLARVAPLRRHLRAT
jgi:hypothetical protein